MSTPDIAPKLTPNQILALVVLMAEAREVSNSELKALAGFSLTGTDNDALEKHGLVKTNRSRRPYSHVLTERGWNVVRGFHAFTPPRAGGSATRSLYTLLANMQRSLDRLQISHGEFFKQTSGGSHDVEAQVRTAYTALASRPGEWVGLADLRARLAGLDRSTVDEVLLAMASRPGVRIIPVADTEALQPRDRAAALRIGDEDHHALAIDPT